METLWIVGRVAFLVVTVIIVGMPLFALPATLTLPSGRRPGIRKLTLSEAAKQLQATGKTGKALVETARALVAERMQYCRRNSFDSPAKAFQRGYGYCTQQAYALVDLLSLLGFEAKVVHAFRNQFPEGASGGHTWVRVVVGSEEQDIDSMLYDPATEELTFCSQSEVLNHTGLFRLITRWGEAALNAFRYYRTGKDE